MERARARIHGGDMVCAATFKHARMPIQAMPLANITNHSQWKACARPAAKVINAKRMIAAATTPSTESLVLSRGGRPAPANAPRPNDPSNNPYPEAPYGRAMIGKSAGSELAARLNAPVRIRTQCVTGDDRTYLNPARMDSMIRPVSGRSKLGRFQRYRKKMTPKNEAAFIKNATPELVAAITRPPSAGPTARATLKPTEFKATAGA